MKNINMSIVYLFYKVFIVSNIKMALINCIRSKAPAIKDCLEQWADCVDNSPAGGSRARLGSKRR